MGACLPLQDPHNVDVCYIVLLWVNLSFITYQALLEGYITQKNLLKCHNFSYILRYLESGLWTSSFKNVAMFI